MRKQIEVIELTAELIAWLCRQLKTGGKRQAPGAEHFLQALDELDRGMTDSLVLRLSQSGRKPGQDLSRALQSEGKTTKGQVPAAGLSGRGTEQALTAVLTAQSDVICYRELVIEPRSRRVTERGQEVMLTPKEFDILYFLAKNRGEVFTKEQIYEAVWEGSYLLDDSNIMAFIRKLRKKIEPNPDAPEYILTVWGIGYQFNDRE